MLLFGIYLIFTFTSQQFKLNELARQRADIKSQAEAVLEQKQKLEHEIQKMNTDDYIEEVARRELGLVKPGDVVYKFVEPDVSRPVP